MRQILILCCLCAIRVVGAEDIRIHLPGLAENVVALDMTLIQPGTFLMGSPPNERARDIEEGPQHEVTITEPFYLGMHEVTQAQWQLIMGQNPAADYGVGGNLPVYNVSWNDCQLYIEQLNQLEQGVFRLPTEAEWEYACRAGTTTRFSFGDALDCADIGDVYCELADQYMWWWGNNELHGMVLGTKEIGLKLPNPWGLYDMHGNVYEWCSDWFGAYTAESQTDPQGASSDTIRVARGGYWFSNVQNCRSAYRSSGPPGFRSPNIGLRLARSHSSASDGTSQVEEWKAYQRDE